MFYLTNKTTDNLTINCLLNEPVILFFSPMNFFKISLVFFHFCKTMNILFSIFTVWFTN